MTPFQLDASANAPCTSTIVGFTPVCPGCWSVVFTRNLLPCGSADFGWLEIVGVDDGSGAALGSPCGRFMACRQDAVLVTPVSLPRAVVRRGTGWMPRRTGCVPVAVGGVLREHDVDHLTRRAGLGHRLVEVLDVAARLVEYARRVVVGRVGILVPGDDRGRHEGGHRVQGRQPRLP